MYKIGVCGHFAYNFLRSDGQTIKTKMLTEGLKNELGNNTIQTLDTFNWKRNPFKLIYLLFMLILKSKNIIILPGRRGIKVFIPLFLFLNLFLKRKLYYVVIGGWLPDLLSTDEGLRKKLLNFDGIYVETNNMKNKLEMMGMKNIHYLPNFKSLKNIQKNDIIHYLNKPFKVCTFSRVMKEKGIEDAIHVVSVINKKFNMDLLHLDIYGQIDSSYESVFSEINKKFPSYITYKGVVDYDKSVEVLKEYFLLLFPTRYKGEGFPGTIIDAFASAVPVVASDWKYNSEIIKDKKTGFIYDNDINSLEVLLTKLIEEPKLVNQLKKECLIESKKYDSKIVVSQLLLSMNINKEN